jgi:4-hydroxybenzoate polyprenyltransferase
MKSLAAWARLARISNFPTAWSNVLMGYALAANPGDGESGHMLRLTVLLVISTCMYAGGMVLNDVFDLDRDRLERPERVLPSGLIPLSQARLVGWLLLAAGLLVSFAAWFGGMKGSEDSLTMSWPVIVVALAAAILAYNAGGKLTFLGPVLMGSCRMLNVLLGATGGVSGFGGFSTVDWHVAAGIGLFVAGVTIYAFDEQKPERRLLLWLGAVTMLVGLLAIVSVPWSDSFSERVSSWFPEGYPVRQRTLFAMMLGMLLLPAIRRVFTGLWAPTGSTVRAGVIACLQSLIMIDAALCFLFHPDISWYAIGVALLVVPRFLLGRRIPST